MPSTKLSKWPYKKEAMNEWREFALGTERMNTALDDLLDFASRYDVLPLPKNLFNMFHMIRPCEVRVVMVGQSPYPGCCPSTGIPYAWGPAFLPGPGCTTVPATLANMMRELHRDCGHRITSSPTEIVLSWIEQGVLLLNSSLTLGVNCPDYLRSHALMWEEIMTDLLYKISKELDPVFVLVGSDAWKFESCISSCVIKTSHPVARKETSTPWIGSGVFSKISEAMILKDELPVKWNIVAAQLRSRSF